MACELSTQFRLCSPIQHSPACGPDQSFTIPSSFSYLSARNSFVSHTYSPFSRKPNLSHTYRKTGGPPTPGPTTCSISERFSILLPPTRTTFPSEPRDPRDPSRFLALHIPNGYVSQKCRRADQKLALGQTRGLRQRGGAPRQRVGELVVELAVDRPGLKGKDPK